MEKQTVSAVPELAFTYGMHAVPIVHIRCELAISCSCCSAYQSGFAEVDDGINDLMIDAVEGTMGCGDPDRRGMKWFKIAE